jgi:hypothetical protein
MKMDESEYIELTLRKVDALKLAGLLCREPQVRPRAWLSNFPDEQKFPAAVLLDTLVYYSDPMTTALLRSTYTDLLDLARSRGEEDELSRAVITAVEDEIPNPSDSGNLFCRKARYTLGVPEARVVRPREALERAVAGETVIFVDDFIGSGEQICKTWERIYRSASPRSFSEAAIGGASRIYYLVLVSTKQGLSNSLFKCPGLQIVPGHVLDGEYSVRRAHEFPQVPQDADLQGRIHDLLQSVSGRLQLKPFMRQADYALYGFHSLGLTFGFEHGVPDASLPILWAAGDASWTPLLQTQ